MGKVINLFDEDLKSCSYTDFDGDIGVCMRDRSLCVIPIDKESFEVIVGEISTLFDRAELAEFLKVASVLVDSEERWSPTFDLIGLDYTT